MCGIVGYIGHRDAVPVLLEGLRRLEYWGYDSAGIAVERDRDLTVRKSAVRVGELRALTEGLEGAVVGIAHTRWATHGAATEANAHPHVDESGRIAVVHNGILENAEHLRTQLVEQGVVLASETDSEVLAHLIAAEVRQGGKLEDAVRERGGVPHGHGRFPAYRSGTDHCGPERHGFRTRWIFGLHGQRNPGAARSRRLGRLDVRLGTARLDGLGLDPRELRGIRRVKILGCGSAYYAGQLGAAMIEELARVPADAEPAE